jgi:hypothetical protein
MEVGAVTVTRVTDAAVNAAATVLCGKTAMS